MKRVTLTPDDLKEQLEIQLGFLKRSVDAFDEGYQDEAIRMTIAIRILVHDTKNSHALLSQLGTLNVLNFYESAGSYNERNVLATHNLVLLSMPDGYKAVLDASPVSSARPFSEWWDNVVLGAPPSKFTRRQLILTAANQDGGGHVDPKLDEEYHLIKRGPAWWTGHDGSAAIKIEAVHLHSIRQIAHEVIATLDRSYPIRLPIGMRDFGVTRPSNIG